MFLFFFKKKKLSSSSKKSTLKSSLKQNRGGKTQNQIWGKEAAGSVNKD